MGEAGVVGGAFVGEGGSGGERGVVGEERAGEDLAEEFGGEGGFEGAVEVRLKIGGGDVE